MEDALALLRTACRERWLALLWLPARLRQPLAALLAFDLALERVVAEVREPLLAEIRLAWWRERLAELAGGARPPAEPHLRALAAHARPAGADLVALEGLEDALLPLLGGTAPALADVAARRGAALAAASTPLVGPGSAPALARLAFARFARRPWPARAGAIADGLAAWRAAPPPAFERETGGTPSALAGLDRLARADLLRLRGGLALKPAAGAGRQLVLVRAAFRLPSRGRSW